MPVRFTTTDMITGLLRALADRGYSSFFVQGDRLDVALEAAYKRLLEVAPSYEIDVRFRMARDDFGESQIMRMALNGAGQRDLVSFDNPEYQDMRVDRSKVEATVRWDRLPAEPVLYKELADAFVEAYEQYGTEDGLSTAAAG